MKRIFSCSTSEVAVEKWNRHDQKLFEAVEKGESQKLSSLLSKKFIRPTKTSPKGQSAFHLAASRGFTDCLSIIISHRVEINAKTDDGCTALHLAASNCHPDCVKLLLQRGAHEDSIDFHSRTPLHCAAASGCVASMLLLCDAEDTCIDAADDDRRTPLMIASQRNHPTVCSLLLDRGAQVNLPDREKKTALILACEKSHIQAAETLLTKGADPTPRDSRSCDALYYSSQSGDDPLMKLIQAALDRRKNEHELNHEKQSVPKEPPLVNSPVIKSKELELLNVWKRRYEEEQKKGLWLQGDLMRKTHELESIVEESRLEKSRVRELVEDLKDLLTEQTEDHEAKGDGFHTTEVCGLLHQVAVQVKAMKERQQEERPLQEAKMKTLSDRIIETEGMQEEVRCLQGELAVAKEKEVGALRRVAELEGHLENMRDALLQFEKRKRVQSSVVEDLQDQISEVTRENEELLALLQSLQEGEENVDNTEKLNNDPPMLPSSIKALKEMLKEMKSECNVQMKTEELQAGREASKSHSSYVPMDNLEKSADSKKKTIAAIEHCIMTIEKSLQNQVIAPSSQSETSEGRAELGVMVNGTMDTYEVQGRHNKELYHQNYAMVESNVPCLQGAISPHENIRTELVGSVPGPSQALNATDTPQDKALTIDCIETMNSFRLKVMEMENQFSALQQSHENLLIQMDHVTQEKQNLEEGLLAIQESLQAEFVLRQEIEIQCEELKQQTLLLSDEVSAEQEKSKKMGARLESQKNEILMLQDSFPPEIVQEESNKEGEMFSSDVLEELYWNVGTIVRKYNEALQQLVVLRKENKRLLDNQAQNVPVTDHNNILQAMTNQLDTQVREAEELKQKLSQATRGILEIREQLTNQAANSVSRDEHQHQIAGLQRVVTALEEEKEAYKVALEGKCEEVIVLKLQLEQEIEAGQVVRSREVNGSQDYERVRSFLETQLQDLREEVLKLSEKHTEACKEAASWKEMITSEGEKVVRVEGKMSELEREAEELRITSQKSQEENKNLNEKCDDLCRVSQEREQKVEESVKELELLTKAFDEQQRRYASLELQLEDANRRHQDLISVYRTHLLNAAQGYMDEDVHFALLWIVKMQNDPVC
ncbi:ankyrin repeat domain-containing protein 35 isoform X2 [Ascaphus truei]|uniref:ankyrin repeat domain-containing protein 35 isoform X2 n=1 Tax=Ascaphus truei TaxID=8439 RepID=UPI003F5A4B92